MLQVCCRPGLTVNQVANLALPSLSACSSAARPAATVAGGFLGPHLGLWRDGSNLGLLVLCGGLFI